MNCNSRRTRSARSGRVSESASFVRSYEPVVVVTAQGKTYNGLVKKDSIDEIVLAINATEEVRLSRDEIDEIRPSIVSVMPSGLDQQLTPQELADLIAFLKVREMTPDGTESIARPRSGRNQHGMSLVRFFRKRLKSMRFFTMFLAISVASQAFAAEVFEPGVMLKVVAGGGGWRRTGLASAARRSLERQRPHHAAHAGRQVPCISRRRGNQWTPVRQNAAG